jgi:hypothetical protein
MLTKKWFTPVDMTDFNEDHKKLLEKFGGTALP